MSRMHDPFLRLGMRGTWESYGRLLRLGVRLTDGARARCREAADDCLERALTMLGEMSPEAVGPARPPSDGRVP